MNRRQDKTRSSLLSGLANIFEGASIDDLLYEDDDTEFEGGDDASIELDDWFEALYAAMHLHSRADKKRAQKLRCTFEELDVDPTGTISGNCRTPDGIYEVYISLDVAVMQFNFGCSCSRSLNEGPCEHSYRFAKFLLTELNDTSSTLRARIGDSVQSEAEVIPYAPPILKSFDHFLASRPSLQEEAFDDSSELHRLAWKLDPTHSGLELIPVKQRPRKRGGGWTKGQRISLDTLRDSPELVASTVDATVVKAIRQQASSGYGYYYQPSLVFDMVEAVDALVGHDLVTLDDEPIDVRRFAFGIRVLERGANLLLTNAFPVEPYEALRVSVYRNGIIARSDQQPLVLVCRCDEGQSELARSLLDGVEVPRDRLEDLRHRLDEIARTMPVEWPETLAGPIVPEETTPMVLLGSRQQGHLECRLRVKDSAGRVSMPGEGALCIPGTRDEKRVQLRRDAHKEITRAREIQRGLDLDRMDEISRWNWRVLDFDRSLRFLEDLETMSKELGFEVAWDPSSVKPIRILGSLTANNVRVQVSKKRDWFGLEGNCKIGDDEFQLLDLLNGVRSEPASGYMEIQPGQWARINAELRKKLQRLRDATNSNRKRLEISETAAPIVQDLLEAQIDFEAPKAWRDCVARLDRAQKLDPSPPESFHGTLRDYQLDGYRWLRRLAEWGVGGCLADDMGLGKTIQALAVLIDRKQIGPALVIAPTSVGFNWVREAKRFAPDLNAHSYRETDRAQFLESVGPGDLVVCSYGLALRDADALGKVNWGTLILDEAQFVKNSRAKTSQAIRGFDADWKLALTGTPMENHLGELWSIFRNISPGLFGSWENFRDRFASPIEKDNDDERREALSRVIRPFVLRRSKSEVLKELPERTEMNLYVELSDEERRRYNEMRLAAIGEIDQIAGLPDTQDQRFRVLAMLTRLRQLACHVGLVDDAWEGNSAKIDLLVETLQELREEGHRALIFSQFTSYLAFIRKALDAAGITYEYLDGSTPPKARQERVDAFQSGNSDAFLISLKAGGTGLNLTAADYVIHMDPWWNPAVEDQATDRAHRIGQTQPVMVYRTIARGTIEEQILDLHEDKRNLVAGVMDGTQAAGRLSTTELVELIRGGA